MQLPQLAPGAAPLATKEYYLTLRSRLRTQIAHLQRNTLLLSLVASAKESQGQPTCGSTHGLKAHFQQHTHSCSRNADSVSAPHCPLAEERLPAPHAQRRQRAPHEPAPPGAPAAPQALHLAAGCTPPSCDRTPTQSAAQAPAPGRCKTAGKQRLSISLPCGNILDSCPPAAKQRSEGKA